MINTVTVTNHLGESVTLEMRFPEKSGFLIKSINGLGPSKANIDKTEVFGKDGSVFNSARASSRDIVFSLEFVEDYEIGRDIETCRQNTYKYFPLTRQIKIEIETDNRVSEVYGYVESNEPDIFSQKEGCVISVTCPNAYLSDVDPQRTVFSAVEAAFEFPFSNESTTLKLLETARLSIETTKSVWYEGDSPVGIVIYIHASGPATNIQIINAVTLESLLFDTDKLTTMFGIGIQPGDDIVISTVKGNKYASLIRGGITLNVLNALGQYPTWFELEKGDNIFAYLAETGLSNLTFRIENQIAYEGI